MTNPASGSGNKITHPMIPELRPSEVKTDAQGRQVEVYTMDDLLGALARIKSPQETHESDTDYDSRIDKSANATQGLMSRVLEKMERSGKPVDSEKINSKTQKKGSRVCNLTNCKKGIYYDGTALKACAACKKVFYCSRKHQTADWKTHKSDCKAPVKAAAAASAGNKSKKPPKS